MENFNMVVETIQFDLLCENQGRVLDIEKINNEEMNAICLSFIFSGRLDHLIIYLSMQGIIK